MVTRCFKHLIPVHSLIHVHASDAELGKIYQAKLPIHAHPGSFLRAIADVTLPASDARSAWTAEGRAGYLKTFDLPEPARSRWIWARSCATCKRCCPTMRS